MNIETLLEQAQQYLPLPDLPIIRQAYDLVATVHTRRKRPSGEDHIQHCLSIAADLLRLNLDASTIAAGLLHDVLSYSPLTLNDLHRDFGSEIARLVEGMSQLAQVDNNIESYEQRRPEVEIESFKRMIIAIVQDARVLMIKMADRLHDLRALRSIPDLDIRLRIAQETMDIFAPLAGRLGMYRIKSEMEDLAFRYLKPEIYEEIASELDAHRQEDEQQIQEFIAQVQNALEEEKLGGVTVSGRPKHIYSIYRKMQRKSLSLSELHDIRAIRIIVPTEGDCYRVLGIVHGLWRPIPGMLDDYIASPKDNSYQSLHTDVWADDGKPLEVQIRTYEMHKKAEEGIAAHWRYKEEQPRSGRLNTIDQALEEKLRLLQSLVAAPRDQDAQTFVETIKKEVFSDQIFVFTPTGEPIQLPQGSTPIDFAYHIHTELGHRCRGANVNGRLVPLNYVLKGGDRVQIITTRHGGPNRDWISKDTHFVYTSRARQKIHAWFRRQDRNENIERGRAMIAKMLHRLSFDVEPHEIAALFKISLDDLYDQVGTEDIALSTIVTRLTETLAQEDQELPPPEPVRLPQVESVAQVQNLDNIMTNLARCCSPVPGDQIIGYVTRARGVTVHRQNCPNILRSSDADRLIEVSWASEARTYPTCVLIRAYERHDLVRDIVDALSKEGASLHDMKSQREKALMGYVIIIQVTDTVQLYRIIERLSKLPNVQEVRRVTG